MKYSSIMALSAVFWHNSISSIFESILLIRLPFTERWCLRGSYGLGVLWGEMEKINTGKNVFTLSGCITNINGHQIDAHIGDAYEYLYVGDHVLTKTIVPHPLGIYLSSNQTQEFFVTKIHGAHVITAIKTAQGVKYANALGHVAKRNWLKVLPVFLLLLSPLSCTVGGPSGGHGPMITLVVLASVFCFFAIRSFGAANRAFRQVDRNVALLKTMFGT